MKQAVLGCVFLLTGSWVSTQAMAQATVEERLQDLEIKYEQQQRELEELRQEKVEPSDGVPLDPQVRWKDGLQIDFKSLGSSIQIGGRLENDWGFFAPDRDVQAAFDPEDGTLFRRARFIVSGVLYENVEFKAEYDFADGASEFTDVYAGLRGLPGNTTIRVGHQREPFSLEEQTSSRYITFLERALPITSGFTGGRNTGVRVQGYGDSKRYTWATGIFRSTDDFGANADNGKYAWTSRVTGLPFDPEAGDCALLHLGGAFSHRTPNDSGFRISQRPETAITSSFVNTGTLMAHSANLFGGEAAFVWGPFSLQGETTYGFFDLDGMRDATFNGHYVQASYFLTGESRPYKRSEGVFDRLRPKKNFKLGTDGGCGAWEVAARFSNLDLTDKDVSGGEITDYGAALNWYLNPNTRVMANVIRSYRRDIGTIDMLVFRVHVDF